MSARLSNIYGFQNVADDIPPELLIILEEIIKKIYRDEGKSELLTPALIDYYAENLWKQYTDAYGDDLSTVDLKSKDHAFLEKVQTNIWRFAAAKDFQQQAELSKLLIAPDNTLRSFSEFKKAVIPIINDYNKNWLNSEYNFAVAVGQMSSKWKTIQENKKDLPLLKYLTVGDDRVRPAHRELDGIIKPVDDKFWDVYFPPNGWNCRCFVQQTREGIITEDKNIIYPDNMPDMFKVNFAKQGIVFPQDHPYFDGLSKNVFKKADALRKDFNKKK